MPVSKFKEPPLGWLVSKGGGRAHRVHLKTVNDLEGEGYTVHNRPGSAMYTEEVPPEPLPERTSSLSEEGAKAAYERRMMM